MYMLKIVYPICCGIDVHKNLLLHVLLLLTLMVLQLTNQSTFLLSQRVCGSCRNGFAPIPVLRSVWNLPVSIGYQCLIFWSQPVKSHLLILSMSSQFVERKPTRRMSNGLPIYSSMTLYPVASCHHFPSVNCVI